MAKYLIIIVILIASIGGILVYSNRETSESVVQATPTPTVVETKSLQSLRDLFSSGISQSCTFSTEMSGYQSEGIVYVANKKMRGDFISQINGKETASHMVVSDNVSYMWAEGQNKGVKITFDENDMSNAEELAKEAKLDINAPLSYDCTGWAADESKFQIPSEVQFTNLEEMMQNIPTGTDEQCEACQKLEGETKDQCLKVLKCS